jgi:CheY-like chemotaxis protein
LLIADDARVMRMLLRTWVERLGFVVVEAASGTEALAQLHQAAQAGKPFDAALCDIHMPGLTGLQVLEAVRQDPRLGVLPIAIITTLGHASDVERGMKLGATAYLTKPLAYGDLLRALDLLLPGSLRGRPRQPAAASDG